MAYVAESKFFVNKTLLVLILLKIILNSIFIFSFIDSIENK